MILEASGMLVDIVKIQLRCMLVYGEALCHFDMFSAKVGSITSEKFKNIILGLGA